MRLTKDPLKIAIACALWNAAIGYFEQNRCTGDEWAWDMALAIDKLGDSYIWEMDNE